MFLSEYPGQNDHFSEINNSDIDDYLLLHFAMMQLHLAISNYLFVQNNV